MILLSPSGAHPRSVEVQTDTRSGQNRPKPTQVLSAGEEELGELAPSAETQRNTHNKPSWSKRADLRGAGLDLCVRGGGRGYQAAGVWGKVRRVKKGKDRIVKGCVNIKSMLQMTSLVPRWI